MLPNVADRKVRRSNRKHVVEETGEPGFEPGMRHPKCRVLPTTPLPKERLKLKGPQLSLQRRQRHADDLQPARKPAEGEVADLLGARAERVPIGALAIGRGERLGD